MTLEYKRTNIWKNISSEEHEELMDYGDRYMNFLDRSKTERECAGEIVRILKEKGFVSLEEALKEETIQKGAKIYAVNRDKAVVAFVMGEDMEEGMRIVGAHIDSPRLDLKPVPLYEEGNMALLKTHYYGGVKKYQWTCIPLALHGVAFNKAGEKIEISIGEDEADPVFYVNDLLIHLSADQMQKKMSDGITGEQLNVVVGHSAYGSEEQENPVKKNILKFLQEKYGMAEEDFLVSELEVVPADKARSVGLDRGMIAGYGHDDRVCAYATLEGIIKVENPRYTAVGLFVDKEEIGSVGNTGMHSRFFENTVAELVYHGGGNDLTLRRALARSKVLSADVNVAYDPTFPEVLEKQNAAVVGHGVSLSKYTGSRGKSGCNDANGEFLAELRTIFDEAGVIWQTGELGKVDQGGGGTIAYILAEYGAEVVDCGTAMLSMHAPIELVSKADAYMTAKAYHAFMK